MKMGKSFNKSMLFVLGIVLVVFTLSGCIDTVEAPDSTEDAVETIVWENIPMNEIQTLLVGGGAFDAYNKNDCLFFDSPEGKFKICDKEPFAKDGKADTGYEFDKDTLEYKEFVRFQGIKEADSPQDQLNDKQATDEPTGADAQASPIDANLVDFSGMTPVQAFYEGVKNPDSIIEQKISILEINDPFLIEEIGTNRYGVMNREKSNLLLEKYGITSYTMITNGVFPTEIIMIDKEEKYLMVKDNDGDGIIDKAWN